MLAGHANYEPVALMKSPVWHGLDATDGEQACE